MTATVEVLLETSQKDWVESLDNGQDERLSQALSSKVAAS
jgi:hypothetical protein